MHTPPVVVLYGADRELRRQGDALLRSAGVLTRVASRPAELAKALRVGRPTLIVLGDDATGSAAALAPVLAVSPAMSVMYQAPGESIGRIVARALGVIGGWADQPRSSE
jgi:hypothetical protein